QNIQAILEHNAALDKEAQHQLLEDLLEDLQIQHIRQSMGMSLSGGERRRVEIARALASQPSFILLDEPFAGVDPISVIEIQKIIEHLTERNIGVLITDHNVRETLGICQHAYILSDSKIIAQGNSEEILSNQQVRDVYLGRDFQL
ncbi:MAG: ATP-binding cassette domain-containing protein, partial [Gammaproteobacteria bacterium]|nr:ATP-binding cassette domain-containing protein [Gammaproteobacteria bacterium]